MKTSSRVARGVRRFVLIAVAGVLPAFIMRCDKAALNFQRGFFQGLGLNVSGALVDSGLFDPNALLVNP